MGTKITPVTVTNLQLPSALGQINVNFENISNEFDDVVYADGSVPMVGNLDLNSNRILNAAPGVADTDLATVGQIAVVASGLARGADGPQGPQGIPGIGIQGPPGTVTGVADLGKVLPLVPSPNDLFASFDHNLYYYQGIGDSSLSSWLGRMSGSFSRGGTEHRYVNSAGLLVNGTVNTPRFTYDPTTLVASGFLYEPATANMMPYSQAVNAGNSSAWMFSSSNVTQTDGAATGIDGTVSASSILETTATGTHYVFYYGGSVPADQVVSGTPYIFQIFMKASGRTKAKMYAFGSGFPDVTIDLSAHSVIGSGWNIETWQNGWHRIWRAGNASSSAANTFVLALLNGAGSDTYTGDGTSGILMGGAMLEQSSTTTPSTYVLRVDANPSSRSADILTQTNPSGVTKETFTFDNNSKQVVTTAPGVNVWPTNLNRHIIKSFISVDLTTASVSITNLNGNAGPTVTLTKEDISGLTTGSTPTFTGMTISGTAASLGASTISANSGDFRFAVNSTALTGIRSVLIGLNPAQSAINFQNSICIGPDSAKTATVIGTAVVIGDTAAGGCTSFQNSNAIGNEAANCSGAVASSEVMGNTALKGAVSATDSQVIGQAGSQYNNVSSSVIIGRQAGVGSTGNVGTHAQSVLIGTLAGSSLLGTGVTYTGNILVGYNIQPPTATTSNYFSFGNAFTYLGSTSTLTLRTPANTKVKLVLKGLAASTSYANDAAAAAGGVGIDEIYRNGSVVQVRVT